MGFTTIASYVDALNTSGRNWIHSFNKITNSVAYVAGNWYDLSMTGGNPRTNVYPGGLLESTKLWYRSTGNIWHGANVAPYTKHIKACHIESATSTAVPTTFMLLDYIMFYALIDCDNGDFQTFDNSITLPRYADGIGVRAFLVVTADVGAVAQSVRIRYTNTAGDNNRWTPEVNLVASAIQTQIAHGGSLAGNYGPFLPLAGNDKGILSVQGIQLSGGMGGGWACLVLCRPLLAAPLATASVPAERDYFTMQASLPRVRDEAFLNWIVLPGAAMTNGSVIRGRIETAWS